MKSPRAALEKSILCSTLILVAVAGCSPKPPPPKAASQASQQTLTTSDPSLQPSLVPKEAGEVTEKPQQSPLSIATSPTEPVAAVMRVQPERVVAGASLDLIVDIKIDGGHYVHADPADNTFKSVALHLDLPEGIEFEGDWILPAAEKGPGGSEIYRNSIQVRRKLRMAANASPQDLQLNATLEYQACTDEACWPPGKLELSVPLITRLQKSPARSLSELSVLYIGSERANTYVEFLQDKVKRIDSKSRKEFKVADAKDFDVVLLDWPQSEENREMRKMTSPLGSREEWTKPTVLLGSAGLNLAVTWKMKGGSGCTCLDPMAYDLRDHEIFERPFPINRDSMISIPTPKDFQDELPHSEIKVLPVVANHQGKWNAGWCTHARDFSIYPDVEFFCGGVNHQTPSSAALWRQGNFLHYGFEQSPKEMNEHGQLLLLNSIAYISRFTEDRAIAVTPSVFAGPVARNRQSLARFLRNPEYAIDFAKSLVTPEIWKLVVAEPSRELMAEWADSHSKFLHPNSSQVLELDEDLVAIDVAFDQPEFFDRTLADLRSKDPIEVARARRLLQRYVPDVEEDAWETWWRQNREFAFASDAGDYRWYVDPLAKSRGIPTSELRGPQRADE